MDDVDYTGGRTVVDVARRLRDRGITFAVVGASDKVRRELDLFGLGDVIGEDRYFDGLAPMREAFAAGGDARGDPGGDARGAPGGSAPAG
jgi:MFS superfamily sulfate permease-like transporter